MDQHADHQSSALIGCWETEQRGAEGNEICALCDITKGRNLWSKQERKNMVQMFSSQWLIQVVNSRSTDAFRQLDDFINGRSSRENDISSQSTVGQLTNC